MPGPSKTVSSPIPNQLVGRAGGKEQHYTGRSAWIRAGVLGANDGLISTASLIAGVAAANVSRSAVLISGIAGLSAGAFSMAAGEYVSVSSQRDSELADLDIERRELASDPNRELDELAQVYELRGLDPALARTVAVQLSRKDPLLAHARDELGIDQQRLANPWQAAMVSALAFSLGAILPVIVVLSTSTKTRAPVLVSVTLIGLVCLGSIGARLGGAPRRKAAIRVVLGGSLALVAAVGIGKLTGRVA